MYSLERVYQPIPFDRYRTETAERQDSEERYQKIKGSYQGSFEGKSLIDLCGANGFFGFRFIQDGGQSAIIVDNNEDYISFVESIASEYSIPVLASTDLPDKKFDIGLYLDSHYSEGTEVYPIYLKDHVKVLFTSAGDVQDRELNYKLLLQSIWEDVEEIHTGFMGRVIYKCTNAK